MTTDTDVEAVPSPEGPADIIETDYQIGQDNITPKIGPFGLDIHNPVFLVSGLVVIAFVLLTIIFQDSAGPAFDGMRKFLTSNLDWFFLSAGNIFVLVCIACIVLPIGSVRLGGRDATPDYSYLGWFSMLFAAGMGIGLMFFGVSEPISHYSSSVAEGAGSPDSWAPLAGAAGDPDEARRLGMAATIFHWGLHPWAVYAIVALGLALFSFNKGLPLTIRSLFYPIFGERVWGWPGHVIDILAVFATLFGLATSLGLGAQQANAGLDFVFGVPNTVDVQVILIIAITAVALISVLRGLDGGVKVLSEINMVVAAALLLFVMFAGGIMSVLSGFVSNLVAYGEELIPLSSPVGRDDDNFRQGWTSFYWAWWISWSPFVGMFIARVSRGRTVREFMIAVLLVPTIVSVLWMTAFGGTAISLIEEAGMTQIADAALELKLFEMLSGLPLAAITSFIGVVLVIVFFVTSSDSGSLVIDTITAGGKVNAPVSQRVFWCTFEGLVAIALLLGGGLGALQAAAVSTGFPFAVILLLACYALFKGLYSEPRGKAAAAA
ncbi:BCCT family transporter [Dichotomicrobium thermohalophilum]|uniref:BCCT family betaine/carnitine transporter n=1 Tax=Dichotomicrobium thermohalophilum TaxID=933063 RepID=A0A397QEF0_9HYPH|nr:BCCT family transporter [Dichotomicrobium thermohalophilum]RIA56641.1 BCCT family betaine/carnitine transporter [Dichotomicrobium thermohalophilum]